VMRSIVVILSQAALAVSSPLFELPREYWGEYNQTLNDCGTGNNDSRLRISWNTVGFHESTGEIEELLRQPDGSIVVVAKHSGEGRAWKSVYQLRLSDDGEVLTVIHPQSAEMDQFSADRRRCPAAKTRSK
jgi:hypothetical protein